MRNIAIFVVNLYRKYLSVLKLQKTCRFYPTCSEYSVLALQEYGFFKGIFLSIVRLAKCHPFSAGGYDPVPSKAKFGSDSQARQPIT